MARKKKYKLPKKIMGFKIPKQMRSGSVAAALASPVAMGLIAEVIYHVGAAASRRATDRGFVHRAGEGMQAASEHFADAAGHKSSALGHAVSEATHAFLDALRDRSKDSDVSRKAEERDGDRRVH